MSRGDLLLAPWPYPLLPLGAVPCHPARLPVGVEGTLRGKAVNMLIFTGKWSPVHLEEAVPSESCFWLWPRPRFTIKPPLLVPVPSSARKRASGLKLKKTNGLIGLIRSG